MVDNAVVDPTAPITQPIPATHRSEYFECLVSWGARMGRIWGLSDGRVKVKASRRCRKSCLIFQIWINALCIGPG